MWWLSSIPLNKILWFWSKSGCTVWVYTNWPAAHCLNFTLSWLPFILITLELWWELFCLPWTPKLLTYTVCPAMSSVAVFVFCCSCLGNSSSGATLHCRGISGLVHYSLTPILSNSNVWSVPGCCHAALPLLCHPACPLYRTSPETLQLHGGVFSGASSAHNLLHQLHRAVCFKHLQEKYNPSPMLPYSY